MHDFSAEGVDYATFHVRGRYGIIKYTNFHHPGIIISVFLINYPCKITEIQYFKNLVQFISLNLYIPVYYDF